MESAICSILFHTPLEARFRSASRSTRSTRDGINAQRHQGVPGPVGEIGRQQLSLELRLGTFPNSWAGVLVTVGVRRQVVVRPVVHGVGPDQAVANVGHVGGSVESIFDILWLMLMNAMRPVCRSSEQDITCSNYAFSGVEPQGVTLTDAVETATGTGLLEPLLTSLKISSFR